MTWMDRVIGRNWPDPGSLAALIAAPPPGTTDLYFHPVVCEGVQLSEADLATLPVARARQPKRKRQINCRHTGRSAGKQAR
jgi:hypothetical protein